MRKKVISIIGIILLLAVSRGVYANSMEPPGYVIIVEGNEEGLEVWLEQDGNKMESMPRVYPFEVQYWFYHYGSSNGTGDVVLHVENAENEYSYTLDGSEAYRNTFTLKLSSGELIEGKSLKRSIILVCSRVILTLAIEAIIFFIMGFRRKRSWMLFLLINLVTQLALNIYINTFDVSASYNTVIALIVGEFWVFLFEGIAFTVLLKEKTKGFRFLYAILANGASLVLGGYLMTWLSI